MDTDNASYIIMGGGDWMYAIHMGKEPLARALVYIFRRRASPPFLSCLIIYVNVHRDYELLHCDDSLRETQNESHAVLTKGGGEGVLETKTIIISLISFSWHEADSGTPCVRP